MKQKAFMITFEEIKKNKEINTYIEKAAEKLGLKFKLIINEQSLM